MSTESKAAYKVLVEAGRGRALVTDEQQSWCKQEMLSTKRMTAVDSGHICHCRNEQEVLKEVAVVHHVAQTGFLCEA